jgi:hypothetical protein
MRNSVIIVLVGIALTAGALAAHAQSVKAPAVGAANPAPPAAASDIGQPEPPKPVLGGNAAGKTNGVATDKRAVPPFAGTDTSTAAPGGHAESSANGALSSPPNGQPVDQTDHGKKPAGTNTEKPED